jgi:RNA polymerase sigma-70 factor (ECF subfamily)
VSLTEAEFRALFDEHHKPLRAYVARRVPNPTDVEDIVIEIFAVLWRRRHELPTGSSDKRMWLYGVARNTVANHRRGSARSDRLQRRVAALACRSPVPADADDLADASVALEALACLSENDQELIRLALWEELTHAQIAQVIQTSTPNVAVRLHRAKRRLRREFHRRMQEAGNSGQVVVEMSTVLTRDEETKR